MGLLALTTTKYLLDGEGHLRVGQGPPTAIWAAAGQ
jgi:hypothetical protein